MKSASFVEFTGGSALAPQPEPERGYVLKLVAVHQDCLPWEWTTQVSHRAIRLLGPGCVHIARWTVEALHDPALLLEATEAAVEADILVISVCADRELSLDLNWWIGAWLPRRLQRVGALVAILAVPQQPNSFLPRIREYLHDVARAACLDFLPQERRVPWEQPGCFGATAAHGAQAGSQPSGQVPPSRGSLGS